MAQEADKTPEVDLGGYIEALNDCPHVNISCIVPENEALSELASLIANPICCINNCDKTECWFCLKCHELFCSRYANKHMNSHYSESVNKCHCIAMGVKDLSFWCFKCDSYINHLTIQKIFEIYELAHIAKHGESIPKNLLKQTKFNKNKNKNIKNDVKDNDNDDNDEEMSEYYKFMNKKVNNKMDYLDHSVDDHRHDELMQQLCNSEHKSCIEWNNELNIPNIEPIINNLNYRKLHVGSLDNNNRNTNNLSDMFAYFSSRNGLSSYSLFSKLPRALKLEYIKLCIDNNIFIDRCIGSLYGMGIGDATGAPLEFIPCVNEYNKSYFQLVGIKKWINEQNAFSLKRGQWTDDASMGLCMADSLIINNGYNGSDIRIRFWNWWNNGYCNAFRNDEQNNSKSSVGLGGNISKSIYSMQHNKIPTPIFVTNTSKDDSGNGSLMRLSAIPVFLCHFINNKQMIDIAMEYAKQSSFTTHPGWIAAEACAFMSYIIIHAINRKDNEYNNNLRTFLDIISDKYLKRIEIQYNELRNQREETIKSKQFNYIKNKMEQLNLNNNQFNQELRENLLENENENENENDSEMHENINNNMSKKDENKYIQIAWSKIQNNLNQIDRRIWALKCIITLIKSSEDDKSTERCWNWKCKYGDLGIDKTMINRGNSYNGYPNTQGYFGSYCMDGLAMGLHSLYNSNSFGETIKNAVNMLGDADSTGSIAGQLAGAWYGFKNVFYDKNKQMFLFKQISKWDDYEFGIRAILLYCIGKEFVKKAIKSIQEKKNNNNNSKNESKNDE